jgi:hypothetical protein
MTPRQLEILQHTLGADRYGRRQRYSDRNYFCAGPADEPDCRELIALGFMKQHKTTEWLPYFNCSATDAGIKAMREGSPAPPKLTRGQQRYRRFLDADCDRSFGEWLKDHCYAEAAS